MIESTVTPESVRNYLVSFYAERIDGIGKSPAELPDSFDFLMEGVVDSLGMLEMVAVLEKEFDLELDMSGLEAEELTVLGPLARYVATHASIRRAGEAAS